MAPFYSSDLRVVGATKLYKTALGSVYDGAYAVTILILSIRQFKIWKSNNQYSFYIMLSEIACILVKFWLLKRSKNNVHNPQHLKQASLGISFKTSLENGPLCLSRIDYRASESPGRQNEN